MSEMTTRDEIETLLPFYLNGTLEGDDLARVNVWLGNNPEAKVALSAVEAERQASMLANDAISPPGDALERFTKTLDAETRDATISSGSATAPSLWAALWEKLMGATPALAWGTTAAALALVVVQAVMLPGERVQTFTEAGISQGRDDVPYVLVVFAPGSDIDAITALLAETGAALIGGPKPGGIYQVSLPASDIETYDRLSAQLAAAPLVAQLLPGRLPDSAN